LRSPMATFREIHRLLRDGGLILVATSELGAEAYREEVDCWRIPDHLHFAGPRTFSLIASRLNYELTYIDRRLTQKVILLDKLSYPSARTWVQMIKILLRNFTALTALWAVARCFLRGYHYPRYEVVVLFQKR